MVLFVLIASGHTQGSPDYYITSLQMPCYPPLARQATLQGQTKVKIEVGSDGAVKSAEAVEGNVLLQTAALASVRTWKFGGGPGASLAQLKTTVLFDYRLEGERGWERCAARVIFDGYSKVEIIGHPPVINVTTVNAPAKRF